MKTLDFRDKLLAHPFSNSNAYSYNMLTSLNIAYSKSDSEIPYISIGTDYHSDNELHYCDNDYQLNRRIINTARFKEILDSARIPIPIKMGTLYYLVGKGFLAHIDWATKEVKLLFVAQIPPGKNIIDIKQVRFYVSREIYEERHKKILPAMKDIITEHTGDVITTSNIDIYVGSKITVPEFKSLKERKDYINGLFDILMHKVIK